MPRALVLISPAAGRAGKASLREQLLVAIKTALAERGFTADFPAPASAEEAAGLLRAASGEGYELAVVAGGDGSVRLGVDALAGGPLPLGIVPLGTGNLLAATLGIARQPLIAATRLAGATPVVIDTGLLRTDALREHFAVAAGLGFDARVMAATSSASKARYGVLAYFATMLRLVPTLPAVEVEISVDGRNYGMSAVAVLIANCGQIIPGLLGPRVALDPTDGVLDVIAIRGGALPVGLTVAVRSALHSLLRADADPGGYSLRLRGERIDVRTDAPEPIEVDGDLLPGTATDITATIRPRSLSVLV
jgi:diacylglycerol kinase (ATP)